MSGGVLATPYSRDHLPAPAFVASTEASLPSRLMVFIDFWPIVLYNWWFIYEPWVLNCVCAGAASIAVPRCVFTRNPLQTRQADARGIIFELDDLLCTDDI